MPGSAAPRAVSTFSDGSNASLENRVPLVRAANTGFSAVVDLDGRIRSRTNLYETAFIVEDLSWPQVRSFYAHTATCLCGSVSQAQVSC